MGHYNEESLANLDQRTSDDDWLDRFDRLMDDMRDAVGLRPLSMERTMPEDTVITKVIKREQFRDFQVYGYGTVPNGYANVEWDYTFSVVPKTGRLGALVRMWCAWYYY